MKRSLRYLLCGILFAAFASQSWAAAADAVKVEQGKVSGTAGKSPDGEL